jgi:hypothetical protein
VGIGSHPQISRTERLDTERRIILAADFSDYADEEREKPIDLMIRLNSNTTTLTDLGVLGMDERNWLLFHPWRPRHGCQTDSLVAAKVETFSASLLGLFFEE